MTSPDDARIRIADPGAAAPCKACGGRTSLFDVTDFNTSCEDRDDRRLRLAGVPIYYRRCHDCGLVFTDAFDDWSAEEFKRHIYNDQYAEIDPSFATMRPARTAELVRGWFGHAATELRILDYGGGNGLAASLMRDDGFDATAYDPFQPPLDARPRGRFNLITCVETFEHAPDPIRLVEDIASLLADEGLVLFSTLLQPADIETRRLGWWYAAPRNGHITLFTRPALAAVWDRVGLQYGALNDNMHLACRTLPAFALAAIGTPDKAPDG